MDDLGSVSSNSSGLVFEILNFVPMPLIVTREQDGQMINLFMNTKFSEIIGYLPEEIPTLDIWFKKAYPDPLYRSFVVKAWDERIMKMMKEPNYIPTMKARIRCANGEDKWFYVQSRLRDDQNYVVFLQVSDFEDKGNNLSDTDLLQNNLLSIISHDLRSPFNSILGLLSLLRREANGIDKLTEYFDLMESTAKNGLLIIEDLLQIARLQKRHDSLLYEAIPVYEFVKDIVNKNRYMLMQKGQNVEISMDKDIVANFDKIKIGLVLDNILSNAIKYSYPGQPIYIEAYKKSNLFEISIKDEGQGFNQEDMEQVFHKFGRLSAVPTAGEKSIGLGLYICKLLVELHQGSIFVQSDGPKKGARITVRLPQEIQS
ncbi:MAG: ATP-binding protein [Cyclobacteriaceae bacterium]